MSVIRDDAIENALQQGIERTLRYRGAPPDNCCLLYTSDAADE